MPKSKAKYAEFKARYAAAKTAMQEIVKSAFQEYVADFFAENPTVDNFSWTQYQMYWNDGDPTHFTVYNDEDSVSVNGEEYDYHSTGDSLHTKVSEMLKQFDDESMLYMFGDHAEVTVYKNGKTKVKSYSHD